MAKLLLVAFAVVGLAGFVICHYPARSAACRGIRRGAKLTEIQSVLGQGIGPELSRQPGWILFQGDPIRADAFIRARIRPDGVVTEVWCTAAGDSWRDAR